MKGFLRTLSTSLFLFSLSFAYWESGVAVSFAQSGTSPITVTLQNPLAQTTFCQFFKQILDVILALGAPISVLFIVYAGFRFVMARGAPDKLTEARKGLVNTLIGIGIFLGAWALTMVVAGTINALNSAGGGGSPLITSC